MLDWALVDIFSAVSMTLMKSSKSLADILTAYLTCFHT